MISVTKNRLKDEQWPYVIKDSLLPEEHIMVLNEEELIQLFKKIGKILNKGEYCPTCHADLPPNHPLR